MPYKKFPVSLLLLPPKVTVRTPCREKWVHTRHRTCSFFNPRLPSTRKRESQSPLRTVIHSRVSEEKMSLISKGAQEWKHTVSLPLVHQRKSPGLASCMKDPQVYRSGGGLQTKSPYPKSLNEIRKQQNSAGETTSSGKCSLLK